jgi:hypothetical protein
MAKGDAMNALPRRRILSGALAVAVFAELTSREAPAQADLFGGDVAVLLAILTQSISQATSLINLVLQTANQVKMMTTLLHQVASGSSPPSSPSSTPPATRSTISPGACVR